MKPNFKFIASIIIAFCIGYLAKGFFISQDESPSLNDTLRTKKYKDVKKVTGIGGIFFKSDDPKKLKEWYKKHLGMNTDDYGTNFEWRQAEDPTQMGFTLWAPFHSKTTYFQPSTNDYMINYRVENLDNLVRNLRKDSVTITDSIVSVEYGKFVHILDLEGNKIELWEPVDTEYDKIVDGRTK